MKKKPIYLFLGIAILTVLVAGCIPKTATNSDTNTNLDNVITNQNSVPNDSIQEDQSNNATITDTETGNTIEIAAQQTIDLSDEVKDIKEVTMTAFYEIVDGQPQPQYSIKQITVKKGDTVRIKVTNTRGNHDFNIDEFNISQPTPLNEEVVIEFKADKSGKYTYYCSTPNHRSLGHWGILTVIE